MPDVSLAVASRPLDRALLEGFSRRAGADDVGFVELERPRLAGIRDGVLRVLPWAKTFLVFVRRLNREAVRVNLHSVASAEFIAGGNDIRKTIHRAVRDLEGAGIRAIGLSGLFPFELSRTDGPPFVVPLKILAEEAGLGRMGKNRLVLHPRFGANIQLGAIVLDGTLADCDRPLAESPCITCNLCSATCPTGAIAQDGHFDFGSCMAHNYCEKLGGFVEWVHTLADSRDRRDYRRRVSNAETLSWWQSLGYEANTHCSYCVAVCPAGDEAERFLADRKRHVQEVVRPLRERVEPVYVVPGSDAEAHVAARFPHKTVRRIGSGRIPESVKGMVAMLPLTFQRGRARGLAARYQFRFRGQESLDVTVDIRDQKISVHPGLEGKADLELRVDSQAWLGMLCGERRAMWEVLSGRLRWKGDRRLLAAFRRCFPV